MNHAAQPQHETRSTRLARMATMASLVFAGEAVFVLPFQIARVFRPTVLRVFHLSNTALGNMFAAYGVIAMLSYFPGGAIADRFPARKLLTISLLLTGCGGLYMHRIPSSGGLTLLFAFWGLTTILLFWAALIRATREWGGALSQGAAFGVLDGGRGLLAAVLASLATFAFALLLPDAHAVDDAQRRAALQDVIAIYTIATFAGAALVWTFVPERAVAAPTEAVGFRALAHVLPVMRMPTVWLQAMTVVCAYCAYKGVDDYTLFAAQAYGFDEVQAARLGALSAWVRPFAALAAGLLADRTTPSRVCTLCFAMLIIGYAIFGFGTPDSNVLWLLYANVLFTCVALFGLRGVYFALLQQGAVPTQVTGTAVGLISVIGYTPDVFMAPLMGWLLDRSPGAAGHQHVFVFLLGTSALGMFAVAALERAGMVTRVLSESAVDR